MLSYFFWALGAFVLVTDTLCIGWLWRRQHHLENRLTQWQKVQQRQNADIAGLCAAAVRIDERLQLLSHRMAEMHEWAQDLEYQDNPGESSYQIAIERIGQGAGVDELVEECGFSREEAALLIRLHRNDEREGSYPAG